MRMRVIVILRIILEVWRWSNGQRRIASIVSGKQKNKNETLGKNVESTTNIRRRINNIETA